MIQKLFLELKITAPWGALGVAVFLGILRLTEAISPTDPEVWSGWVSFLEIAFPLLPPLLLFTLLEREKSWRTLETLATTPYRKAWVFLERYLIVMLAVFLGVVAGVRPQEYLVLMGSGLALGGMALVGSLVFGEEIGLALSLGWWGFSLALAVAKPDLLGAGTASWFFLILSRSPLLPAEVALRRWGHLGMGLALLLFALGIAERKRSWHSR